jgi:glycosyltransferase involved in cell wall biosynthesis
VAYRAACSGTKRRYLACFTREMVSAPKFDLVLCGLVNFIALSYVASKLQRIPAICILHGVEAWQPPRRPFSGFCLQGTRHIVAVSEITRSRFLSWSRIDPARVSVIPNTVATGHFRPGPKDPQLAARYRLAGKRVLLTVGRLDAAERYKGVDEVLGILPELLRRHGDLAYLIVGDGTDRARLESVVKQRRLEPYVRFAGYIAESEKAAHYRLADAYVMPSRGEGFGIVFLEALACGIPVVASKTDGGREAVLDGRLGTLVDPDDPSDVIRGIEIALGNPSRLVPPELRQFEYPAFEKRWHALFEQTLIQNR